MGRIVTVTVPMPTNGITNDPRDTTPNVCRVCTNFDIATDPKRAIPYADSEDGDSNVANDTMQAWCIALGPATSYKLFGLGRQTATNKARIFYKNLTTGGSTDLSDNGWTETTNNTASNATPSYDFFMYYPRTGYIYGAHTGANIFRYDPTGSGAFVDAHQALTYTHIAQGIVHSQDDIMYVPYDNKIATNDNGAWDLAALTLPSEFYITSICEYGAFVAIACAPLSGVGRSRLFIWNRSSSLTEVSANADLCEGIIKVLEELQGDLVGISISNDSTRTKYRVTFRRYIGAPGTRRFEEFTTTVSPFLFIAKQKVNNRIFFLMSISLNGALKHGVWSVAKNEKTGRLLITHERTPANDTAINSGPLRNFYIVGDYFFIAYVDASSAPKVSKTNDQASYTATSIIETIINPDMPDEDKPQKKRLISCGATYDPLPSAGMVVVKGRVNGASSYTTIFTEITDNAVKTEPRPVPEGGAYLDSGEELEFQLNSTGGAVPTALIYKYEVLDSNV